MLTAMNNSLINKISRLAEECRELNLSFTPPILNENLRENLILGYHPNYIAENFKTLNFGANTGEKVWAEIYDAISSAKDKLNTEYEISKTLFCDVLVIGGGGAGAAAAIEAKNAGADVILATKFVLGTSNTSMAKGGIQAAVNNNDSPVIHFDDANNGSHNTANKDLLNIMTLGGKNAINWLESIGVMFDKNEFGAYKTFSGGGVSQNRMLCIKDTIGLEIMKKLKGRVIDNGINVLTFMEAVHLNITENRDISGAIFWNSSENEYIQIRAKAVIIATGGCGSLKCGGFNTSNAKGTNGDGLALAYNVGAKLVDMDSLQYHPTGAVYPENISGSLITEKARALGAKLINIKGEQFINPLDTRDVVTAAIIKECEATNSNYVLLDIPMIDKIKGEGAIVSELNALYRNFLPLGIDITKAPIPVYPTLHYQNGGIEIDKNALCVGFKNLFACGEVAGGIHGKNRLMGNSLLDIIVFGRIAGQNAGKYTKN